MYPLCTNMLCVKQQARVQLTINIDQLWNLLVMHWTYFESWLVSGKVKSRTLVAYLVKHTVKSGKGGNCREPWAHFPSEPRPPAPNPLPSSRLPSSPVDCRCLPAVIPCHMEHYPGSASYNTKWQNAECWCYTLAMLQHGPVSLGSAIPKVRWNTQW